jgi:hypothetical protein
MLLGCTTHETLGLFPTQVYNTSICHIIPCHYGQIKRFQLYFLGSVVTRYPSLPKIFVYKNLSVV